MLKALGTSIKYVYEEKYDNEDVSEVSNFLIFHMELTTYFLIGFAAKFGLNLPSYLSYPRFGIIFCVLLNKLNPFLFLKIWENFTLF